MDNELVRLFRNEVNESNLVYQIYKNYKGKNKWNIICSAIDWIEVSLEGIDVSLLSRDNDNKASIKMLTFIQCIDNLWEAIQQLHRVFFDTNKIPFQEDRTIFNQQEPDNQHFKTIRACFSAHPVNLKYVYEDDKEGELWYASWSGGTFASKDFAVFLYSNNPEKDSRLFNVSFDDLYRFAEIRYRYLNNLLLKMKLNVNEYLASNRENPIITGEDILQTIDVLIEENAKRFKNDYYENELKEIKLIFSTSFQASLDNESVIEIYKNDAYMELMEIYDNLQNMSLKELRYERKCFMPMEIQYQFSKLSNAVWDSDFMGMSHDYVKDIAEYFSGIVTIDENCSYDEIYVLSCAGAFMINNNLL